MTTRTFRKSTRRWLALLPLLIGVAGCSDSPTIECTGRVLLEGQPVANASVMFVPEDGSHVATGRTDNEGRFCLTTVEPDDGALAGKHAVSVTAVVPVRPNPQRGATVDDAFDQVQLQWLVPQKYANPETSGLTATVGSEEHDFLFELEQ